MTISPPPPAPLSSPAGTYTPGHVLPKRLLILVGLGAAALGVAQLWTPLRLSLTGSRATAEAIRVVKEKPGTTPLVFTEEAHVRQSLEVRDRSFVFWNEFRFATPEGRWVEVRCPIGTQLKPLYPLTDGDGLPTTDLVCYDVARPEHAVFPLVLGTWLAPAVVLLLGVGAGVIGAVMLHWARKPIAVPRVGDSPVRRPPILR